ncbi:integral membrane protein, putatine family protein [Streptomyces sp. RSD-27]|nr:integral membrane protein, putatine family protein [Streptomyces sp. RSD-27]
MLSKIRDTVVVLAADVPTPGMNAPQELTSKVSKVLGIVAWMGTAAGVAGVLITGAMMAISMRRGEGSEHMGRLGMVLGGCILVATAGPLVSFVFN